MAAGDTTVGSSPFARVSAACGLNVADIFHQQRRLWVRLHEKGGKFHEMRCHHTLEGYLAEYLERAQLADAGRVPLFQAIKCRPYGRGEAQLNGERLHRNDAWAMVRRRAKAAGITTEVCNHTFRGTGITTSYGQKIRTASKVGQLCHSAWARRALSVTFFGAINGAHCEPPGKMGELMEWARILAYISGTVDQELLLRNEHLAAENQILRGQLKGRPKLSDAERAKLGEIGRRLGRKALGDVATAALPDTILGWYRRLVARKFDGSKHRRPGRPRVERAIEELIVRMAEENRSWGYQRIVGALANWGRRSACPR